MFIFSIFLLFAFTQSDASPRTKRLVGGYRVAESQFPFVADLREKSHRVTENEFPFGDEKEIIIEKYFRHSKTPDKLVVFVGITDFRIYKEEAYHSIFKLTLHPAYKDEGSSPNKGNDIGIIELIKPLQFGKNVKAINLPIGVTINAGDKVIVTGWEASGVNDFRYIEGTIFSNNECFQKLNFTHYIGPERICTAVGLSSKGDSGSPLVYTIGNKSYIVGITSWCRTFSGLHCKAAYPAVFTNVSYYVYWIKKVLAEKKLRKTSTFKTPNRFSWFWVPRFRRLRLK